jgi:uncharacterized membrane protein HdeD (DUF308 family)
MRSVAAMRVAKIGYIVMSVVLCLLGVLMIVRPDFSIEMVGIAGGVCLILFGVVKLVGYFSKDLFRLAFQYDLAFGVLLISLGIILLLHPDDLLNFLCLVLGIAVLADGLFKVQIAVDSKQFGIQNWWLILTLAILTGALGLVLVFRPSESAAVLMTLFGVALLAEGILNLCTVLSAVKIVRHQRAEHCIEVDFREID